MDHVIDGWLDGWLDRCLGGKIPSLRDWYFRRRWICFDCNSFQVPAPIPMRPDCLRVPIFDTPENFLYPCNNLPFI